MFKSTAKLSINSSVNSPIEPPVLLNGTIAIYFFELSLLERPFELSLILPVLQISIGIDIFFNECFPQSRNLVASLGSIPITVENETANSPGSATVSNLAAIFTVSPNTSLSSNSTSPV